MKKISVIVPVYNTEEYIEKCINSITGQTYKNLEIIVVNDGSTDNSLNILKSLQSKDSRIRIINQENKGVSAARNTGLDNATGEYIAFVDSDDYLERNMYEKMLKYMEESGADLVSARAFIIERSNKPGENDYNNYIDTFTSQAQILKAYADGFLTIAVWDKLFTKEVIGKKRFDSSVFCEDAKFVLDICENTKKVLCTSERLYYHLKRIGNSLTNTSFNNFYMTLYFYIKNKRESIIKTNIGYEQSAQRIYFNTIYHLLKVYKRDWDNNKLDNYYKNEIEFLSKEMLNFLSDNEKYIDDKLVIGARDIVELLNYRLSEIKE